MQTDPPHDKLHEALEIHNCGSASEEVRPLSPSALYLALADDLVYRRWHAIEARAPSVRTGGDVYRGR